MLPVYLGECMLLALNPIKNDLKICDAFTFVNSVWKGLIRMYVHSLFKFDKILWWVYILQIKHLKNFFISCKSYEEKYLYIILYSFLFSYGLLRGHRNICTYEMNFVSRTMKSKHRGLFPRKIDNRFIHWMFPGASNP